MIKLKTLRQTDTTLSWLVCSITVRLIIVN